LPLAFPRDPLGEFLFLFFFYNSPSPPPNLMRASIGRPAFPFLMVSSLEIFFEALPFPDRPFMGLCGPSSRRPAEVFFSAFTLSAVPLPTRLPRVRFLYDMLFFFCFFSDPGSPGRAIPLCASPPFSFPPPFGPADHRVFPFLLRFSQHGATPDAVSAIWVAPKGSFQNCRPLFSAASFPCFHAMATSPFSPLIHRFYNPASSI